MNPDDLSEALDQALRRFRRLRWISIATLAALVAAALFIGGLVISKQARQLNHDTQQITKNQAALTRARLQTDASCSFWKDIGTLPLSLTPPQTRPSYIGVALLVHARTTFRGQACPGTLAPASILLRHWAVVYKLPQP